jgi:hypothetical protein
VFELRPEAAHISGVFDASTLSGADRVNPSRLSYHTVSASRPAAGICLLRVPASVRESKLLHTALWALFGPAKASDSKARPQRSPKQMAFAQFRAHRRMISPAPPHPVGGRRPYFHSVSEPRQKDAPLPLAIRAGREVAIFITG